MRWNGIKFCSLTLWIEIKFSQIAFFLSLFFRIYLLRQMKWMNEREKRSIRSDLCPMFPYDSIGINVNKKLCSKLKNFLNETDETNYNESPHANLFISIQLPTMCLVLISLFHTHTSIHTYYTHSYTFRVVQHV